MDKYENEFELDGVTYTTKPQYGCEGCSFLPNKQACHAVVCSGNDRVDRTSVIFVKKPESKPKTEKEFVVWSHNEDFVNKAMEKTMKTSEAKQYDVSDKSKEYWEIICEAYDKQKAEFFSPLNNGWVTAVGTGPGNSKNWFTYDWRVKLKNRAVTLEIPEDLEIKCSMYDTTCNGLNELRLYCKDKETLEKISKSIQKS